MDSSWIPSGLIVLCFLFVGCKAVVMFSRLNHSNGGGADNQDDPSTPSKHKKREGKKDRTVAQVSRKKPRYVPEDSESDESGYSFEETFEPVITMKQIRSLLKRFDAVRDDTASLEEILNFAGNIHNETLTKAVPDILKALDHIKDGKLSLKEVLDDLEESEEAQMMTQDELKTMKELETLKFGAADADGDGKLDLKEVSSLFYPEPHSPVLQVSVREFIKKRDTDGDGKISADEFWTKEDQQGLEDDYNYNSTHNMSSSKIGEDIFKKLDKDGDGLLDTDELMEWESGQFHMKESFQELFDLADKDKDHHLSVREIEKAKRDIAQIEAQYHLMQWMEHFEL